jgi:hypothetical protein
MFIKLDIYLNRATIEISGAIFGGAMLLSFFRVDILKDKTRYFGSKVQTFPVCLREAGLYFEG